MSRAGIGAGSGRRRMREAAAGLALVCVAMGAGLAAPSIIRAEDPSGKDLEAKVQADAARAAQFGKASAGNAPTTPSGPVPTAAPGEICLLGVCTHGSARRADPVPGWVGMDQRSFMLAMLWDFVNSGNCMNADRHRQQLAAMPAPRDEAERKRRDDLTKTLNQEVSALKGVDCAQYRR